MKKNYLKESNGITLVALVITIIVLLILSAVTLNMVVGSNGIFSKANTAREKTRIANIKEAIDRNILEEKAQDYNADDTVILAKVKNNIDTNKLLENIGEKEHKTTNMINEKFNVEVGNEKEKYTFEVSSKGAKYKDNKVIEDDKIPEIKDGDILFAYKPSSDTNGDVEVSITINNSELKQYTLQYKTSKTGNKGEENDWTNYNSSITLTRNQDIYVRVSNGINSSTYTATGTIANIDKLAPEKFTPQVSSTSDSITISATATDAATTDDYKTTGIGGYSFSKDNGATWTEYQESGNYKYSGLTQNTKYNIKVKAKDNVGNEIILDSISQTTQKATYKITYNANGGTGAPSEQSKTHDENITLSSTKPTRNGYTFRGWATSASATKATYQPGATYATNSNLTLYAVWTQVVTFSNGTTLNSDNTMHGSGSSYSFDDSTSANIPKGATITYTYEAAANYGGANIYINDENVLSVMGVGQSDKGTKTYKTTADGLYNFKIYGGLSTMNGANVKLLVTITKIVDANGYELEFK